MAITKSKLGFKKTGNGYYGEDGYYGANGYYGKHF
jgi:hypothetical protein